MIYGQCTESLKNKLKSHADFAETHQDGIALLRIIKVIMYLFEQASHQEDELMALKKTFYSFKQGNNMMLQHYYDLFISQSQVLKEVGATITDLATVI